MPAGALADSVSYRARRACVLFLSVLVTGLGPVCWDVVVQFLFRKQGASKPGNRVGRYLPPPVRLLRVGLLQNWVFIRRTNTVHIRRTRLSQYLAAGFSSIDTTLAVVHALARLEVGLWGSPHCDSGLGTCPLSLDTPLSRILCQYSGVLSESSEWPCRHARVRVMGGVRRTPLPPLKVG